MDGQELTWASLLTVGGGGTVITLILAFAKSILNLQGRGTHAAALVLGIIIGIVAGHYTGAHLFLGALTGIFVASSAVGLHQLTKKNP